MREIRLSGSEGGGTDIRRSSLPLSAINFPGLRTPRWPRGEQDVSHRVHGGHRGLMTPWRQRRGDPRNVFPGFFSLVSAAFAATSVGCPNQISSLDLL